MTKTLIKIGMWIMVAAIVWNISETLYFCMTEGWHYQVTSVAEHTCDKVAKWISATGFLIWLAGFILAISRALMVLDAATERYKSKI